LFGATETGEAAIDPLPCAEPWPPAEIARREKAAVGFYLSVHPLDNYTELLAAAKLKNIGDYGELHSGQLVKIAGMISMCQIRVSKRGSRFCTFRLEDRSGGIKGIVFSKDLPNLTQFLKDDELVIADGSIEVAEGQEPTLRVSDLKSLDVALTERARVLKITLPNGRDETSYFEELYRLIERERGGCQVQLSLTAGSTRVSLEATGLNVAPSRALQQELEDRGCLVTWSH
jgi:DNA polymerase-3 subunit alpha